MSSEPDPTPTQLPMDPISLPSKEFLAQVDQLSASFKKNDPCSHASISDFLAPEFCEQPIHELPECHEDALERFRANNMRGGKSKKQTIRELGGAFLAFDELIKLDEFLAILSKITGIHNLNHYRGGAHQSLNGERLLPRIAYNYHPGTGHYGRLNLLVYLNPEWKQKWVANWNFTPILLMQAQIAFGPVQ